MFLLALGDLARQDVLDEGVVLGDSSVDSRLHGTTRSSVGYDSNLDSHGASNLGSIGIEFDNEGTSTVSLTRVVSSRWVSGADH